jgi:anti-sigma B factor antagonist
MGRRLVRGDMTHPPHHLEITAADGHDDQLVLILRGDIDLRTGPKLRERLEEANQQGAPVVIDLRGVDFVDSPGLGTIIYCHQLLRDNGLELVLRAPQPQVRELFEMVQLGAIVDIA